MVFEIIAEEAEFLGNKIQEAGCDVASKPILRVKVNPDLDILFKLMDGLCADAGQRYWISEQSIEVNACDMKEDMEHRVTEVKIALLMSHNTLTNAAEYTQ